MNNTKLTSVKILQSLYNQFKLQTVNTSMTLQKITNRTMDMYLKDNNFKDKVDSYDVLIESGSNF